jgi:HNH endonuclease
VSRFVRRESPPHFDDCQKYRPFLRRDFLQLCAYCERSEIGLGGDEFFEIDHFRPESKFSELKTHYPNLYYACGRCNRHKSRTWPSNSLLANGFRFADPCQEDMYVEHLRESEDGSLDPRGAIQLW